MAIGLQINNSSGTTILDTSGQIGRYVTSGSVTLTSPSGYADISVPGMVDDDSWFIFVVETSGEYTIRYTVVKSANSFRLSNTTTTVMTKTFEYWVIRI